MNRCIKDVPSIYVDTASSGSSDINNGSEHEVTAIALAGDEWFIQEFLNRRDILKGRGVVTATPFVSSSELMLSSTTAPVVAAAEVMQRGGLVGDHRQTSHRPAAERICEITQLYESGILTKEQFEKKKQQIIDEI